MLFAAFYFRFFAQITSKIGCWRTQKIRKSPQIEAQNIGKYAKTGKKMIEQSSKNRLSRWPNIGFYPYFSLGGV
jgi:hypothetical protein